jgi:hypothetical protein
MAMKSSTLGRGKRTVPITRIEECNEGPSKMEGANRCGAKPRLPQFFQFLIPLVNTLADMGGSAAASEVIDKVMAGSRKNRGSSKLSMQIHEARTFLTKAGYLICPQRGIWNLTTKGKTQPIRQCELPEIHRQNRGWRSYWFDEQQPKPYVYTQLQQRETDNETEAQ